jgi:hypothetical protein
MLYPEFLPVLQNPAFSVFRALSPSQRALQNANPPYNVFIALF